MPSNRKILETLYEQIDFARLARACPGATPERVHSIFAPLLEAAPMDSSTKRSPAGTAPTGEHPDLVIHSDGGARGNPGPAAIGVAIKDQSNRIVETISERIGKTTNNVAEYRAVIRGAERAVELGVRSVSFCVDSELIAKQILGEYKTKSSNLRPLLDELRHLLKLIPDWNVKHVYREQNKDADELVNAALDARG